MPRIKLILRVEAYFTWLCSHYSCKISNCQLWELHSPSLLPAYMHPAKAAGCYVI
nr:MAG TPA: hypothetical protein [Caudoviricetes sp.]